VLACEWKTQPSRLYHTLRLKTQPPEPRAPAASPLIVHRESKIARTIVEYRILCCCRTLAYIFCSAQRPCHTEHKTKTIKSNAETIFDAGVLISNVMRLNYNHVADAPIDTRRALSFDPDVFWEGLKRLNGLTLTDHDLFICRHRRGTSLGRDRKIRT
jgi:hypothetical protein